MTDKTGAAAALNLVTNENVETWGEFGMFRKRAATRISEFTVPAGTTFQTPEGLRAEDEAARIAIDVQGGVYPIRESVFLASYEPFIAGAAAAPRTDPQTESGKKLVEAMNYANWVGTGDYNPSVWVARVEAEAGAAESGASPAAEDRGLAALRGYPNGIDGRWMWDPTGYYVRWDDLAAVGARPAALPHGEPVRTPTHGRHCPCSACAREDWTNPTLAPCGMHGPDCPRVYAPTREPARTAGDPRVAELEAALRADAPYFRELNPILRRLGFTVAAYLSPHQNHLLNGVNLDSRCEECRAALSEASSVREPGS